MKFDRPLALVVVQCCSCFVEYAIPQDMKDRLLEKREAGTTYCPNGHQWHYTGESDEKLAKLARQRADAMEQRARAAEQQLRQEHRGKSQCPVCDRWFKRLSTHRTQSKHWSTRKKAA